MTASEIPWARFRHCRAREIAGFRRRCELKPGHLGEHRAEEGEYDVIWNDGDGRSRVEPHPYEPIP